MSLAKKKKIFNINNVKLVPKKINFAVIERRPLYNTLSTNKFRRISNTKNFKLEYFFKKIKENKKIVITLNLKKLSFKDKFIF